MGKNKQAQGGRGPSDGCKQLLWLGRQKPMQHGKAPGLREGRSLLAWAMLWCQGDPTPSSAGELSCDSF